MIDKENGYLQLNDIVIPPGCTLNSVSRNKFKCVYHIYDMETGWKWVRYISLKIEELYVRFSFGFFQDQLKSVSFAVQPTPFERSKGWDDFDEALERERAKQFNDWLTEEIGDQRDFSWGKIEASYSPKSASSSININYDDAHDQFGKLDAYEIEYRELSPGLEKYLVDCLKEHSFSVKWTFAEYGAFKFYRNGELLNQKVFSNNLRGELYDHISRKMGISRHADEISKGEGTLRLREKSIFFNYHMTLKGRLGTKTKSDTIKLS